ncbi:FKBP70 [Symbiodinium sp. CCMP2592]|nr:FKBP70 [Symbiodinium sp. CCMP2592]
MQHTHTHTHTYIYIYIYTHIQYIILYIHIHDYTFIYVYIPYLNLLEVFFKHPGEQKPAQVTPCCRAQAAWDRLLDGGGCGGAGPTEQECNAAMHQCRQCQTAVSYYALNRTAASNVSVDVSSTRVECELPPWNPNHCARSVKGFGIGVLIATGISLLIVASVGGIAFDWRLLPAIVSRERRKLLVEAIAVQDKVQTEVDTANPSAPLPPRPVPPAPPTPTARPPAQNFADSEALRLAAAEMEVAESPTVLDDDLDAPRGSEVLASPCDGAPAMPWSPPAPASASPSPPAEPTAEASAARQAGRRPRHYASAYALHKAFMLIACIAMVLRVSYIVARVVLVVGLRLAYECLPELLLCILPFVWVACTSRRPKSSTAAVPMSVAYWGPWLNVPRFTTYAVCTICTEIYSTLMAALAVAQLPCNASPLAGVLLYCVGLFVAVARAYCAVLALRLQDDLNVSINTVMVYGLPS